MARVTYVAAVIGDLEHLVGEVFNLTCPRESVPAAKFLIARSQRHTVAFAGIRGSAQMDLRLSRLTSRRQIVIAISAS